MLVAARFVQGIGGAMTSAVILGMIVTMFPEPARAGEGDRRLRLRRLRRRLDRPARRRRADAVDQLALDLLREHPDRDRHRRAGDAPAREGQGHRLRQAAPTCSARCSSPRALMLLVYTIVDPAAELRLGREPHARARRASRSRCSRRSSCARRRPRNPLIPLRIFRSRNVSGANLIQVVSVAGMFGMFFMGSLYMQRVLGYDALQIGLAFLPGDDHHGRPVARLLAQARHALRRAQR